MAEEEKPKEQPSEESPKRRRIPPTLVIIAVVTVLEGALFFGAAKFFGGGPETAYGEEQGHYAEGQDPVASTETVELELLRGFRVPNDKRGQVHIYDFDVYLKIPAADKESLEAFVESHRGEISDRIARIVRAAEPTVLHEPELKTLRMKIRQTLAQLLGDPDKVLEVLIPRCVPMRGG